MMVQIKNQKKSKTSPPIIKIFAQNKNDNNPENRIQIILLYVLNNCI